MVRTTMGTAHFAGSAGRDNGGGAEIKAVRGDTIRRVAGLDKSEARFSLRGEFDISNKWQLFAALTPCVDFQTFTIDLAYATFIDASILGVFVQVARRRQQIDAKRLRIVNVSTHFRKIEIGRAHV